MRRATLTVLAGAALLVGAPGTALAAAPEEDGDSPPAPTLGALTLAPQGGIDLGGRRYVLEGQRVTVEGQAARYAPDGHVTLEVSRTGGPSDTTRVALERDGARARFRTEFTARRRGVWRIRAVEPGGAEAQAALNAVDVRAGHGSRGLGVKLLQGGLRRLGYVTSTGGRFDGATGRAVLAFRKTNGMRRRAVVGHTMLAKLIRGYAIHGFRSVPVRPASHGCIRVPNPDAVSISRWISLGDRIHVYR